MRRILGFFLVVLLFCASPFGGVKAQDPQFTQFFANPLYLSPSYSGANQGHRFVMSYRDQWSVVPNMFRTLSVSYDINVPSLRSGFGVFVLGDLAGDGLLGTIRGGVTYSFSVPMGPKWNFRPGIGVYFQQRSLNYSKLVWGDQLSGGNETNPTSVAHPGKNNDYDIDASSSVLFHDANGWIGATWDHMLKPKDSFFGQDYRTPWKWTIYGGYRFVLQSSYRRGVDQSITVATNFRLQGRFSQAEIGGYWFKYPLLLGAWYRGIPLVKDYFGSDAVSMMAGLRFAKIQVAYSYDMTVSKLGPASGGSHEISFTFETPRKKQRRRYKALTCPPF
ncbi:MAG: hypothetical protein CSA97_03665 [Bacteroidetes bacterium]|nr:MAG: hypothetical protein CSA97_03665 [Bacteroidota bacterium]